jgi:hypothetical protein
MILVQFVGIHVISTFAYKMRLNIFYTALFLNSHKCDCTIQTTAQASKVNEIPKILTLEAFSKQRA